MVVFIKRFIFKGKKFSTSVCTKTRSEPKFETDSFTNVTPKILSYINRKLYTNKDHPLGLIKNRIIQFFYHNFKGRTGNPIFSVHEDLNPVVSLQQNFDSLLVPEKHPSRAKTDCYYFNEKWMLRAHMTAHQSELLRMGLNNFLMIGDVYRRDEIDSSHYPVFHQIDGVRLFTPEELFLEKDDGVAELKIKEKETGTRTKEKQEVYTFEAITMVKNELKKTLEDLSKELFGDEVSYKWVEAFFPFTHPSWELEVLLDNKWIEILGCGIIEHSILEKAGCGDRIGWAFGLGLERLAMLSYSIPDIRIFWSLDPGFLDQFQGKSPEDKIKFKPVSIYPPCPFDISFWITEDFESNDFYEWAREHWGEVIERIYLFDCFVNKKTGRKSRSYRIVYRSMEKTFNKKELNQIHKDLEKKLVERFKVELR